jgi:hypothetical protein
LRTKGVGDGAVGEADEIDQPPVGLELAQQPVGQVAGHGQQRPGQPILGCGVRLSHGQGQGGVGAEPSWRHPGASCTRAPTAPGRHLADLDGARDLLEQALVISRRVLGDDHPDTLTSMNNLNAVRDDIQKLEA